ncbi:MAG TPA: hypothetical protein VMJ72_00740, partial [Candidatus Paceibacterota bacterium]|nr:hypothetical protein [Candidatus Paceibacterota bacterium]
QWSTGCAEEFLIAIQSRKRTMDHVGRPLDFHFGACLIRRAIDGIDHDGLDPKPLYDLWRQIDLTLEAMKAQRAKRMKRATA